MPEVWKPSLWVLYHIYEPDVGKASLYFLRDDDPDGPPIDDDPEATKLLGPTSNEECEKVMDCVTSVLERLGIECRKVHGCDD